MLLVVVRPTNRHPVTDVRQLLQHKRGLRVFGIRNKAFGNRVVRQAPKVGFLPGQLLQPTFGRLRVGGLIRLTVGCTALLDRLDVCAGGGMAVRRSS